MSVAVTDEVLRLELDVRLPGKLFRDLQSAASRDCVDSLLVVGLPDPERHMVAHSVNQGDVDAARIAQSVRSTVVPHAP